MSSASDFVIDPNGMLRSYVGPGGDVVVPDNVTAIGADMGNGACGYIAPFRNCLELTGVVLPEGLKSIGPEAFRGCSNLRSVTLPSKLPEFGSGAFRDCDAVCFPLKGDLTETQDALPGELARGRVETTEAGFACLILFQKSPLWRAWKNADKLDSPAAVFVHMMRIIQEQELSDKRTAGIVAAFILRYMNELPGEQIRAALALYQGKKCKEIVALEKDAALQAYLAGKKTASNPIEEAARAFGGRVGTETDMEKAVKKGIRYRDSESSCTREVLISILSYYAKEWKRCARDVKEYGGLTVNLLQNASEVQIDPEADRIAAALDPRELSAFLEKRISGSSYRPFLLSWARFADEQSVKDQTSAFITLQKKNYTFSQNLAEALMISPTREAMLFFDRNGMLDRYAAYCGTTAMVIRDTKMLPEFGFDQTGAKCFDIGGNIIEVRLTDKLGFVLFDQNKGKEVKDFPRKSDDPAKAEAAAEEYKAFKKAVTDFAKLRTEQLKQMHQSGAVVEQAFWREVYLQHPVVRHLGARIIWADACGKTFFVNGYELQDASLQSFVPQGAIHVAHVLEMQAAEIDAWRHTLAKCGRAQLFEQIWEPVLSWRSAEISARYTDTVISSAARNALKANLKQRGIKVYAGEMDREYDGAGFYFSGANTMYFGESLRLEYTVDDRSGDLTLGKASFGQKYNAHAMNAILFELDKVTAESRVRADDISVIQWIDKFTLAQITEFIAAAQEANAVNVLAALLEYKNANFADFDPMDEFTLEW